MISRRLFPPVDEITIVSGKGGTGKTTICASFAAIAGSIAMADCDVDASDLHILLQPDVAKTEEFRGSDTAVIDKDLCTMCGVCELHCRFDAVHPPVIDDLACEGCGLCKHLCPEGAVVMKKRPSGHIHTSRTRFGPMVHARLLPGEGHSGKLVTEVRRRAVALARSEGFGAVLIDGSPGIGCPVIASLTGISLGIVVAEPTVTGVHDMSRVLDLLTQLGVPSAVIINKFDINADMTHQIMKSCGISKVQVLGVLPFDKTVTESMVAATTMPEYAPNHRITGALTRMWQNAIHMDRSRTQ